MIYKFTNKGDLMKMFLSLMFLAFLVNISPAKADSKYDLTFNIGVPLSQQGNIKDLGDPNLSTGFGFNYYFKRSHGIGFGYNNESTLEGSRTFPQVKHGSFSTFDLHYVYRHIMNKFHLVFEPGIGRQTLYDLANDYYWGYTYSDSISTALVLNYKLFLRYMIADLSGEGDPAGNNFFIGLGLIHNFSFDDSLNGKDISGNRLSALFQIGLAW
jgi:hypothetical protein